MDLEWWLKAFAAVEGPIFDALRSSPPEDPMGLVDE